MVRGYNMEWLELWKTIPLHVETYAASLPLSLSRDPVVSRETILELWFSHPIDVSKTEISIQNTITQKNVPIQTVTSSTEDLRIIIVTLSEKMELSIPYEMTLQKIVSTGGLELSAESRIPLKIIYAWILPSLDSFESVKEDDAIIPHDEEILVSDEDLPRSAPVMIDSLPQTWSGWLVIYAFLSLAFFIAQKKLFKRA